GVRVGEVLVRLGDRQKKVDRVVAQEKEAIQNLGIKALRTKGDELPVTSVYVRKIADTGFKDLVIIPMGADKVIVRSLTATDVATVVDSAKEFFKLFLSNWVRWEKEVMPVHRGAWVRLYGIPLHAWNENFFKLCVFDCGRFLRADSCTIEKDRLDYARVLIATPALEVVNRAERLLVDGVMVEIQIMEEWGYTLGDDACLFEDESEEEASHYDNAVEHGDKEASHQVDMLV
ncbi:sulfate transporter, partial [Trifolium medium]|nr:sulfate transporter [Trifolium medium]